MASFKLTTKGDFSNTFKFLKKSQESNDIKTILEKYGQIGVAALSAATPINTGKTASSWEYEIKNDRGEMSITWSNTNVVKHVNIAIILQYGHATRNGGYVTGVDYINPALAPVFEKMANEAWEEVKRR